MKNIIKNSIADYVCPYCGKKFNNTTTLNIHVARYEYPKLTNLQVAEYESIAKYGEEIPPHVLANYYDRHGSIKTVPHLKQFVSYVKMVQCVRPFDINKDFTNFYTKVLPFKTKHPGVCNSKELANLVFDNQEECDKLYQKYMLEKNPYYGVHDSNRSPFSMDYVGYEGMTDEEKRAHIAKITKRGADDRTSTQVGYWLKKGYTEEEAKAKISERQVTFSLEKCIERYGEEEGRKRWQERQDKWQDTLNNKPEEEKIRINRAKMNNGVGYSKISQDLFWKIYERVGDYYRNVYFATIKDGVKMEDDRSYEWCLIDGKDVFFIDFYIRDTNKAIEFDGIYWHNRAGQAKRDEMKNKALEKLGCKLYRVKEEDYRENPDLVVELCIKFIKQQD